MLAGVGQDLVGRARTAQGDGPAAELLGQLESAHDVLPLGGAQPLVARRLHVHRHPFRVDPCRHAAGGPDELHCLRARPDADQEPLPRRPGLADALLGHVAAHLGIDALGRAAQGQLAEGDQVALAEEALDGAPGLLGHVDLALAQPLLEHVR